MLIVHALAQVPARRRACAVLRYFNDLSVAEIANMLGWSPGMVKSQTARGLDDLRTLLSSTASPASTASRRQSHDTGLHDRAAQAADTNAPPLDPQRLLSRVRARRSRRRALGAAGGGGSGETVTQEIHDGHLAIRWWVHGQDYLDFGYDVVIKDAEGTVLSKRHCTD